MILLPFLIIALVASMLLLNVGVESWIAEIGFSALADMFPSFFVSFPSSLAFIFGLSCFVVLAHFLESNVR